MTTNNNTTVPAGSTRWAGIAGIAFAPLFLAGFMLSAPDTPETDAPVAEWADFATDDGTATIALGSTYLLLLAGIALVPFTVGLAQRIRTDSRSAGIASSTVFGLGVLAAGVLAAAAIAINTSQITYLFDDLLQPTGPEVFVQLQSIGLGFAMVALPVTSAVLVAVTSASLRAVTPGWFTVFGYVVAVGLLGSLMFFPILLLPIWVLIAGILMLRSTTDTHQTSAAADTTAPQATRRATTVPA